MEVTLVISNVCMHRFQDVLAFSVRHCKVWLVWETRLEMRHFEKPVSGHVVSETA